jgi:hypothetical protein
VFGFVTWPSDRRKRLLSVAGALVLVMLCGTASAVYFSNAWSMALLPITEQAQETDDEYPLGIAPQPLPSASRSPSPTLSPPPATAVPTTSAPVVPLPSAAALTARYKTIALLGLGGFDTEVTLTNPGDVDHETWTVSLTMPGSNKVQNLSPGTAQLAQDGKKVTITSVKPLARGASLAFTLRYPALLALGQSASNCEINGAACSAG